MPRVHMTGADRAKYQAEVMSDVVQVQYVHPSGYTTSHLPPVDATSRYLAVPPVRNTNGPVGASSNAIPRPTSITFLRENDPFYLRMDAAAETRYAARIPGDVMVTVPLNYAVNTLSFAAVAGTAPLLAHWNHGD